MQSFLFFLQLALLTAFEQHLSSLIISTCPVEIMEKEFAGSSHCHLYTSLEQAVNLHEIGRPYPL